MLFSSIIQSWDYQFPIGKEKDPKWWKDYLRSLGLTEDNDFR